MDPTYLFWIATISLGSLLGTFLKLPAVGLTVLVLVVLTFVVSFTAAYLHVIQAEWLLLLMGVLPAAGVVLVAAVISNVLTGLSSRLAAGSKADRAKG